MTIVGTRAYNDGKRMHSLRPWSSMTYCLRWVPEVDCHTVPHNAEEDIITCPLCRLLKDGNTTSTGYKQALDEIQDFVGIPCPLKISED